eukprot:4968050-Pleurochrysis_carterae.AAC.1
MGLATGGAYLGRQPATHAILFGHTRMHDSCAASNEWRDSVHCAALTLRLLGGCPSTPPAAGPVSRRPRPLPTHPSRDRSPAGDTGGRWVGENMTPACALATPSCGVVRENKTPPPQPRRRVLSTRIVKYLDHVYYEYHILYSQLYRVPIAVRRLKLLRWTK